MKKLLILVFLLAMVASIWIGCTSTQLDEYFELETPTEETVENEGGVNE